MKKDITKVDITQAFLFCVAVVFVIFITMGFVILAASIATII